MAGNDDPSGACPQGAGATPQPHRWAVGGSPALLVDQSLTRPLRPTDPTFAQARQKTQQGAIGASARRLSNWWRTNLAVLDLTMRLVFTKGLKFRKRGTSPCRTRPSTVASTRR